MSYGRKCYCQVLTCYLCNGFKDKQHKDCDYGKDDYFDCHKYYGKDNDKDFGRDCGKDHGRGYEKDYGKDYDYGYYKDSCCKPSYDNKEENYYGGPYCKVEDFETPCHHQHHHHKNRCRCCKFNCCRLFKCW